MSFSLVDATSIAPQPWRNGGGRTRELLAWPAGDAWRVRVSRADIDRDGAFSAFPQVERWFAVLQGAGVVLRFTTGDHTLRAADDALRFDGAAAPHCHLLDGPTQDLNLMLRQGRGEMRRWRPGEAWNTGHVQRGLYTTLPGTWRCAEQAVDLPANTLLWCHAATPDGWNFEAANIPAAGSAWWLGFTAQE